MEGSTRASAASVIPPEIISIPSDADNASSQNQTKKPMVQYVIGQAAPQSEPTMDLAAAKSILDQLGIGQNTPAEQTDEDVVMTNESGERPAKRAKKPKAEVVYITCDLCGVIMSSEAIAQLHYAGKKHLKKLKAQGVLKGLMDNKEIVHTSAKRTVVAPTDAPLDPMDTSAASARTVVAPSANGDGSATILKCEVCDIEFNSPTHAEMHYQGKKHAKKVKLLLEGPTPQPEPQPKKTKAAVEASQLFCELCKINTTGVEQMKMHLEGAKHKSTEAAKMNPATVESGGGGGKLIASYDCNTCNVQMNSEQQFLQHMGSPKHQTKLTGRPDKARFHPYQKPGLGAAGGAQQGTQQVGQQAIIPAAAEDISEVIQQQ